MKREELLNKFNEIYNCFNSGNITAILPLLNIDSKIISNNKIDKYQSIFPSDCWSLFNQFIVNLSIFNKKFDNSIDIKSAGYKQWNKLNRNISKGQKSIAQIFVPLFKKEIDNDGNEETILKGFMLKPVFFYYQTEGQDLKLEEFKIPLNFKNIINKLNLDIKTEYTATMQYGSCSLSENKIVLNTDNRIVFYHELAHAVHKTIENLNSGQDAVQELIAELTAIILSSKIDNVIYQHNIDYIKFYTNKIDRKEFNKRIMKVLNTTDKILTYIFDNITEPVN